MSILRSFLSVALLVTLASAVPLLKNVDVPDHSQLLRPDTVKYRLGENVKPSHYVIKLVPNIVPDHFTFEGESTITISVDANTTTIVLHAKNLTISQDKTKLVDEKGAVAATPKSHKIVDVTDLLTIEFDKNITKGTYNLYLAYTGILHDDLNGFYRSSYINEMGKEVWLATTQFEPTHARRAFPCFDEPAMKATFDFSISHYRNYTVRFNTPEKTSNPDIENVGKFVTQFETTPNMSSYLIAFIVSDFASIQNEYANFTVFAKRNAIDAGYYAHEIGQKELQELEKYTGVKYDMKKMDNFAIPQFRAGAMENWGIVTYRESALLFEENVTTTEAKQGIATVISHEFAHQWFGNLVSPLWWKYTWLNEGFANYFQYVITDKVETTWRLMDQFVIKNLQEVAFMVDDKEGQHPMDYEVNSPQQISSIFDSISYSKAGCVIRMFSHALTEAIFQKGLNTYLTSFGHGAAQSKDLFNELVKAAEKTVDKEVKLLEALTLWAEQPGYPVITVTIDVKTKNATVSQKRFLSKKPATAPKEKWWIPISYVIQESKSTDATPKKWIENVENSTVPLAELKDKQWVIFNNQQTGYYRVDYDKTNWQLITKHLLNSTKYTDIHELNRAQLLDDSFNLAQAGYHTNYEVFLEISKYLEHEVDYVPWHAAFRAFGVLNKALANTAKYDLFKLYMLRLTKNLEKSVNYTESKDDEHVTKFNRNNVVNWACHMGSAACRDATHKKLIDHITDVEKISVDLHSVVFCAGMRKANASIWEKAFKYHHTIKDTTEHLALLNGLGCSSDAKVLRSFLEKSMEPNTTVTTRSALKAVYQGSATGLNVAFDFIIEKYPAIYNLTNRTDTIVTAITDIASRITTKVQSDKLQAFINANNEVRVELKDRNVLGTANSNIEWLSTNEKLISSFLDAQKLVDSPSVPSDDKDDSDPDGAPGVNLPTLSFTVFFVLVVRLASSIY